MMLRPRHYSTLNKSIARSITFAMRNNNKNKYKSNNNSYPNPNNPVKIPVV